MNQDATRTAGTERVSISCPGCGRHDWVSWPAGQDTLKWTCFNCHKSFDLHRKGGGH
jgi:transposase-like protein